MSMRKLLKRTGAILLAAALAVMSIPDMGMQIVVAGETEETELTAEITIKVLDSENKGISDATVTVEGTNLTEKGEGIYFIGSRAVNEKDGVLNYQVEKAGYESVQGQVSYAEEAGKIIVSLEVTMYKLYTVSGIVSGADEQPLSGVTVTKEGSSGSTTGTDGRYAVQASEKDAVPFTIHAKSTDNKYAEKDVNITSLAGDITMDIQLEVKQFKIQATKPAGGSVQIEHTNVAYDSNEKVIITADEKYSITKVQVNNADVPTTDIIYQPGRISAELSLNNITEDKLITAEFAKANDQIVLEFNKENALQNEESLGLLNGADLKVEKINEGTASKITIRFASQHYLKSATSTVAATPVFIQNDRVYEYIVDQGKEQQLTLSSSEDQTVPIVGEITGTQPQGVWVKDSYNLTLEPMDTDSGIYKVLYGKADDIKAATAVSKEEAKDNYKIVLPKESYSGKYYIFVVDKAGNTSKQEVTVEMDDMVPVIDALTKNTEAVWTNGEIQLTIKASDNLSEVAAVYFNTTDTLVQTNEHKAVYNQQKQEYTVNVSEKNFKGNYYVWAADNAGNVSAFSMIQVQIDTEIPKVGNITQNPAAKYTKDETSWNEGAIVLNIPVSDEELNQVSSGIAKVYVAAGSEEGQEIALSKDGYVYTIEPKKNQSYQEKYSVWCVDNAGNKSEVKNLCQGIDSGSPWISNLDMKMKNDSGFSELINKITFGLVCNKEVVVTITAADDAGGTGVKEVQLFSKVSSTAELKALTEKRKQEAGKETVSFTIPYDKIENQELPFEGIIYACAWDNVGNKSENVNSEMIMIEESKPTADISPDEKPQCSIEADGSSFACYQKDISFTITAADNTAEEGKPSINSGIRYLKVLINGIEVVSKDYSGDPGKSADGVKLRVRTDNEHVQADHDGAYMVDVYVTDFAGNVNDPVSLKIYKDNYAPKIGTVEKSPSIDWANQTVTVTMSNVADQVIENAYTTGVEKVLYSLENNVSTGIEAQPVEGQNGTYQFTVEPECEDVYYIWAVDYAHNVSEQKTMDVKIDRTAPVIKRFQFEGVGTKDESETDLKNTVDITDYGFYFKDAVEVTIHASDSFRNKENQVAPSSSLKNITYYAENEDGVVEYQDTKVVDENGCISFVIGKEFKGQIYAKAEDIAGNTPADDSQTDSVNEAYVHPEGTILEGPIQHEKTSDIILSIPEIAMKDRDGKLLFSGNVPVSVSVSDNYSGIRRLEWSVASTYDTQNNQSGSLEIDNQCVISGQGDGWNINKKELNLVTSMSRMIQVQNNSNDITVCVKLTDRAGNVSEKRINFSIDKTLPDVSVTYDNNAYDQQFIGEREYYNANRNAVIQIKERNFNAEEVKLALTNEYGEVPELSGWTESYNSVNPDETTYTAYLSYTSDGDYKFSVDCIDLGGNRSLNNNAASFVIDKTNPSVSVQYDNNTSSGGFFDKSRTATITIEERNFETGRIEITGTARNKGQDAGFPSVSGWSDAGDTHVATITYNQDAEYTFSIAYTDKAGNQAAAYSQDSFVVDQTSPVLEIKGVEDKSANREDVLPVIQWSDTNLSGDAEMKLTAINHGDIKLNGEYSEQGEVKQFTFNDFEYKQELDDIYILTATVEDLAGNKTEKKIQFSVNRFGSVYTFSEGLRKVEGKYINQEQDVIITETNVDTLTPESIKVKVSLNGESRNLSQTNSYQVSKSGGDGNWCQYTYKIPAKEFANEGNYIVSVSSKDVAGNVNANADETKKAEIRFGIDKTAPVVIPLNIDDGKTYPEDSMTVQFDVADNLVLEDVVFKMDGKEIKPEISDGEYSFVVDGSNQSRTITALAYDAAGNETELSINKFYVTTNLLIRWYTNTILFVSTIIVLVLLATVGVIVIIRKGKRYN